MDVEGNAALGKAQSFGFGSILAEPKVMLNHALNMKQLPLGNSAKGKFAIGRAALNYEALKSRHWQWFQYISYVSQTLTKMLYLQPYRSNVMWTGKGGLVRRGE
jgi:hypothetical protein